MLVSGTKFLSQCMALTVYPAPASQHSCLFFTFLCTINAFVNMGGWAAGVNSSTEVHRQYLGPTLWTWYCIIKEQLRYFQGGGLVAKSCPTLETPWTVASQAPLPMGFSRQEYWSGLPFPSPIPKGLQSTHQDIQHTQEFQCLLLTVLAPKHPWKSISCSNSRTGEWSHHYQQPVRLP